MPLTLTISEGVVPSGDVTELFRKLTDSMLKWHGLTVNKVMTPNVIGTIDVLPRSQTFSGGKEVSGAWVEWKVPAFAFSTKPIQEGFFAEATKSFVKCLEALFSSSKSGSTSFIQLMAPGTSMDEL